MSQQQFWLFSSSGSHINLPIQPILQTGVGDSLEGQTVVVPVSLWDQYVASTNEMRRGPARVILYMDIDILEPTNAWELTDAIVAGGDAAGLAKALAGRSDSILDWTTYLPSETLRDIAEGKPLENLQAFRNEILDKDLIANVRRAAELELDLRGLYPLIQVATAQVPAEDAAASLIAALILIGWVRTGVRPRPGPALRGPEEEIDNTPEDVETVLQAGLSLEGTLGTTPLTFSFDEATAEGPALLVSASTGNLTLEIQRTGKVVWSALLRSDPIALPLSILEQGDHVVISSNSPAL